MVAERTVFPLINASRLRTWLALARTTTAFNSRGDTRRAGTWLVSTPSVVDPRWWGTGVLGLDQLQQGHGYVCDGSNRLQVRAATQQAGGVQHADAGLVVTSALRVVSPRESVICPAGPGRRYRWDRVLWLAQRGGRGQTRWGGGARVATVDIGASAIAWPGAAAPPRVLPFSRC